MDKRQLAMGDVISQEELQGDYEHTVTLTIERYGHEPAFPRMDDYKVEKPTLDSYLFDKQAAIDSEGSERSRYTVAGLVIMLPILVIAAFPMNSLPWKENTIFAAIAAGLLLYALVRGVQKLLLRRRINAVERDYPEAAQYANAVMAYRRKKLDKTLKADI